MIRDTLSPFTSAAGAPVADREVIPERHMHAMGWDAFGTFTLTHDISQYTRAKIFNGIGKKTDAQAEAVVAKDRESYGRQVMSDAQKRALFDNTARAMGDASVATRQRHVDNCIHADTAYGAGVAAALGL